jgi:ureidoglycolate dehydrogenase (NAD+)/L-2-hydroxycarboxylate dehydrogenase (NAD+)
VIELSVDLVRQKLVEAGLQRGLSNKEATILANYHLDANLRGMRAHGVGRFVVDGETIRSKGGPPKVIKETPVAAFVDGDRELGPIAAQFCLDLLLSKVKNNGIGMVALKNASRYSHLAPFGQLIASSGYIGIITNSAGPVAVAPYGSYTPILGTNPLCMAFPSGNNQAPIVLDFATSETVWAEIRQAMLEERDLLPQAFYTKDGSYAVHPEDANAVRAFDGPKGFSLCLAIEILCGAFIGAKMGSVVNDEYDLGFLFLALDPLLFRTSMEDFYSEVDYLAKEIRNASPLDPNLPVRIPGDKSSKEKEFRVQKGMIELDEKSWEILCQMAIDPDAGMTSSALTN